MKKSPLNLTLDIDIACKGQFIPPATDIDIWLQKALQQATTVDNTIEIGIRILDETESAQLNQQYRSKSGSTNILSFSYSTQPLCGDLAICASVVNREAEELSLEKTAHWAHIIVHGVLHLLGFDHEQDDEAEIMENLETKILATLGVDNPYEQEDP